jgi:hypothetical protein
VQFEATVYVPVTVAITPSWDDVSSPVYVPVVESNVTWLTPVAAGMARARASRVDPSETSTLFLANAR